MFTKYKMITKKFKKVCKRLKIRLTIMRNGKRIPKSEKVLVKQLQRKMKKMNRFGAEEPEKKSFYQTHKKKIKIAAGVLAAAAVLGGGHYAATRTTAGQKHLAGYNKMMNTTGKNIKTPKSPKPDVVAIAHVEDTHHDSTKEFRKEEDELMNAKLAGALPEQQMAIKQEILTLKRSRSMEDQQKQDEKKQAEKDIKEAEIEAKKGSLISSNNLIAMGLSGLTGNKEIINTGNPVNDLLLSTLTTTLAPILSEQFKKLTEGGDELSTLQANLDKAKLEGNVDDVKKIEKQIKEKEEENKKLETNWAESATIQTKIQEINQELVQLNEDPDKNKKKIEKLQNELKELEEQIKDEVQQTEFGKRSLKVFQRMAKKQGIKITFTRGGKKVYKSAKVLEHVLRKSSFGKNYRQRIYNSSKNIYQISKKKFYEVSKIIAKGMLSGIGIFTGLTISIVLLFKYMEYRKIQLDPMVVLRLFNSTDSKGKLHVDKFINSAKRNFDVHAPHFVSTLAKEVRKEVPGVVQEVTMSGLGVIQQNSMMLMMPMMMALSSYFSKQMQDLTVASVKKGRNVSGIKGWETRKKNETKKVSGDILADIINNSYQTAKKRNFAAKKIQKVYKKYYASKKINQFGKKRKKSTKRN